MFHVYGLAAKKPEQKIWWLW